MDINEVLKCRLESSKDDWKVANLFMEMGIFLSPCFLFIYLKINSIQ